MFSRELRAASILIAVLLCGACGKKGPPLPPLLKLPVAPANLTAERRGDDVTVRFTVPANNTDNTKPANVERVDVYAFTGPSSVSDDDLLKHGKKVGSVDVKAPKDPDQTVDEDESTDDVDAPEGKGLEQGAAGRVDDRLTAASLVPNIVPPTGSRREREAAGRNRPLVGPSTVVASRVYVGVAVNKRGRHGPVSKRVAVPLVEPPPAPSKPTVNYDETTISLTWGAAAADDDAVLPSHPLGTSTPSLAYNVYEVGAAPGGAGTPDAAMRLTKAPTTDTTFVDTRMDWTKERCYTVRAIESLGDLKIESPDSAPRCVTLTDTFPPAAPKGLQAVPSEGAISLLWDTSPEADLAGYLILRGESPTSLAPVTSSLTQEVNFKDTVPSGIRYFYAIVAVDKAGNKSKPSAAVDETARD